ncbi:nuclease-related domain-containing protein [Virgibacillus necropolis]|uniref:nuclease-related domain-containing protein n=1 Tax=Virgibacillus necropolis TaxID=163877 RepID=UPI00137477D6|nr:nuclease-related domain-containing protein [Virgibacillus necropolis]
MIGKERETPLIVLKLEALLRRIPTNHPQRLKIEESLRRYQAGYWGEQSLDYHFNFLKDDDYIFFHGLRLPWINKLFFQIDSLLLTSTCIILLEIKNMVGTIYFDIPFQQMIRTLDGKETSFPCPIVQSNRHVVQLTEWLRKNRFPNIPILNYVVFSNSSVILKTDPIHKHVFEKVLTAANLPNKLNAVRPSYPNIILNKHKIDQLNNQFIQQHVSQDPDVIEKYGLEKSELLTGITCSKCNKLTIIRKNRNWLCPICKSTFTDSHIQLLIDYLLLISPTITNKQFRYFSNLESPSITTKLFQGMNFQSTGTYKNRQYQLSLDQIQHHL